MQIKQGDLFPDVEVIVKDEAGVVVDVTGATVTFYMRKSRDPSSIKINGASGSVPGPGTNGKIRYAWAGTDTDTPSTYEAEFRVALGGADPFRVPTTGYIPVEIEPKVGT